MRMHPDDAVSKPMTPIGTRPVLWQVMRDYAHIGHAGFLLCLGFAIGERLCRFLASDDGATELAVRAEDSLHVLRLTPDWHVTRIGAVVVVARRINGGDFVLRREIFDLQCEGEDLVCVRAATGGRVHSTPYDGFWAPMDTVHEGPAREELHYSALSSWAPWHTSTAASAGSPGSHHSVDLPEIVGPTPTR